MIIVGTTPGRENWLAQCLTSINKPVMVLSDFTYELGKIKWVIENTKIEKFMFLQDSVVVKDHKLFELLEEDGSIALSSDPVPYGMYLGVYERKVLSKIDIPTPQSKKEAIDYEITWTQAYCSAAKRVRIAFDNLNDKSALRKEVLFGRENLVLENDYLIKYKGNWGQKPALD
jgi:hypothetical protein